MTRRGAIAGLLGAAASARGQSPPSGKLPTLCVSSAALTGVGYAEIGEIVSQLGFDGIDLTVMPHGIVEPRLAPVDEVRALESVHGAGLSAPIITTALTTPYDPWCRTVLALAGRTGVGLAKSGLDQSIGPIDIRRFAGALVSIGREYEIAVLVKAANDGLSFQPKDARMVISGFDSSWTGLVLDSSCFAEGGSTAEEIQAVLPLVKAATVSDFQISKSANGEVKREYKPLGQGSIDFARMFGALAHSGFRGPVTVERFYKAGDEPGSLNRDAEYSRKQMQSAYSSLKT